MENEEIVKINADEVQVNAPTTMNVEEIQQQVNYLTSERDSMVASYNAKIAVFEEQLAKAETVGVVPDGVIGEVIENPAVDAPVEVPTEETPIT